MHAIENQTLIRPPRRYPAVRLLLQICSGRFSHHDGFAEHKHRVKFALRSLFAPAITLEWLELFLANRRLLDYLRQNPRVAKKPHRPYLHKSGNMRQRLQALQSHYRFECSRFPPACLRPLLQSEDLRLASLDGRSGAPFSLVLTHRHNCDKEGELSLQLRGENQQTLVYLTFAAVWADDGYRFIIGGIQGPRRQEGNADTVRQATKELNGLFPKRIAVEALQMLAQALQVTRIEASSKQAHVYNSWRYRRHFEADYNHFFEGIGGVLLPDGQYLLPGRIARKATSEIASKKRAEYTRRYQLLDALEAQIHARFSTGPAPTLTR